METLKTAQHLLQQHMNGIELVFKKEENMRFTLIARSPTNAACYVLLTSDDLDKVIELLQKSQAVGNQKCVYCDVKRNEVEVLLEKGCLANAPTYGHWFQDDT